MLMRKLFTCLAICFQALLIASGTGIDCDITAKKQTTPDVSPKVKRLVLITGCGRSGTGYMKDFLKASGLDVRHEYMGADGSVSWLMAADVDRAPWGPLSKDFHFKHVFHQIRDPLKVMQSFYDYPPRATWEWISDVIPEIKLTDSDMTKVAKYWYYWNLMAEAKAEWSYRIEDFDKKYIEMGRRLGLRFDKKVLAGISKKNNSKGPVKTLFTWSLLKAEIDPDLYEKICKLAERYGYAPQL